MPFAWKHYMNVAVLEDRVYTIDILKSPYATSYSWKINFPGGPIVSQSFSSLEYTLNDLWVKIHSDSYEKMMIAKDRWQNDF